MNKSERGRTLFFSCCLALSAAFVVWQILQPREGWLYPVICAAFILTGVFELLLRRPPKTLLLVLLCLVYFRFPMFWRGSTGSATWLRVAYDCFYVPVGCIIFWIVRLVQIRSSKKKKKQKSSCA